MLVTSIFSFVHSVFKGIYLRVAELKSFGKGIGNMWKCPLITFYDSSQM